MNLVFKLIPLIFIILNQLSNQIANANEVIGCGGFIKSNTEINFKIIKVKLLTKDGAVKYTTEASTVNGYYMIPIYNKGEYILQVNPPPGWSFEPNQVSINVDGQSDPCSKNEDINFFFKGFGLSGKVVTLGDPKSRGPANIKLNLLSNNQVISSTLSGSDGSYYFSNVMPGNYQIEASHSTIKFQTSKVNVELSKENWSAKDNIVVAGFKLEGYVTTADKNPIQDAVVELHFLDDSFSKVDTKNFVCDLKSKKNLHICDVKTDLNGKFTFSNVAFAKYRLVASLKKENLEFTMKPEFLEADLTKHDNLVLSESFVLNSVSINSKALVSEKDKPLTNGDIFLNGQKYTNLNKDGTFKFDKLVSGSYKIEIKTSNVYFEEKLVNLDLNSLDCLKKDSSQHQRILSLTKFVAKSFDVCGYVKIKNSGQLNDLTKSVQIKCYQVENDKMKLFKSVNLDENFKYCLVLDSNTNYVIKAELSENLSQVLRLAPIERKLTLTDSALFDVNFEQLEAKLEGKINLLQGQDSPNDLKVYLKSVDSKWTQDIPVKCVKQEKNFVQCSFSLNNLLFGNYFLTTNYDDLFCWKTQNDQQKFLTISVNSELQNVLIEQTGYKLNYKLSHRNVLLKIADLNKNVLFTKNILSETDQTGDLCLPKSSDYLAFVDSCHKFSNEQQDSVKISSNLFKKNSNTLNLNAFKHQVTVDIVFKFDDLNDKNLVKKEDLKVEVRSNDNLIDTMKFSPKSETEREVIFTSKTWLEANQQVNLIAKSDKVLFEINNKVLRIDEHNCEVNYVKFEAILGIFISGSIKPTDVDLIDLTLRSTVDNSPILQSVVNSAQGFKLGPLKAPYSLYSVELSKSGYLFNKLSSESKNKDVYNLEYHAQKLGQLKVSVVDGKSKTNLENVLLSLSSENRLFRQTIKTDQTGQVSFDNLKPGLYYLIVMMQEYDFKPNSHPVQITDGFQMNLVVEANRVAYSCFGRVTSINGQAENDVLVEAVGFRSLLDSDLEIENCRTSRENSEVDTGIGTYRIRNLKPNCEYELKVASFRNDNNNNKRVFRIVPEEYLLKVNESDVLDRNFVVIDQLDKTDVSVAVSFRSFQDPAPLNLKKVNNFVRVKLFKTNQPDVILQTQLSPANSIIYFNMLPRDQNQQYSVLVELLMPSGISVYGTLNHHQQTQLQQQPVIEKTEISFYTDSAHKHLIARFDLDKKSTDSDSYDYKQQQYQNVYFTLPLFVLIVGLVLNSNKAQKSLNNLRVSILQKGGLVNYLQLLFKKSNQNVTEVNNSKQSKSNKTSKRTKEQNSDNEIQQKVNKQKQSLTQAQLNNDQGSTDQSESENIGFTTEEGDMLVLHPPVKRKVKKTY